VIFADVQLQRGDDAARLRSIGLLKRTNSAKFPQPCTMHDGCRCAIYLERPEYCRKFECVLLKQAETGKVSEAEALRTIKRTKKLSERVRELLRQLGDDNESVALSKRFQAMRKRIETGPAIQDEVEIFALLTVAVLDLNVALSEHFYR
jgi:hypothetical protein